MSITRRDALKLLVAGGVVGVGCERARPGKAASGEADPGEADPGRKTSARADPVVGVEPLGATWQTLDPFLFCAYHDDAYPAGNEQMGPAASLAGRQLGSDFGRKDGWSMYHGQTVPGFPRHPHRGFETVSVVRRGLLDHSDSLGATARYGEGDVQWLTAGAGILHAEMFPLVRRTNQNPLEMFQLWLNLPQSKKMVQPHFSMLWKPSIPVVVARDVGGVAAEIDLVAGRLGAVAAPSPPPNSWAADPESDVAIWTIKLAAEARWVMPPARPGSNRALFYFRGSGLSVGGRAVDVRHRIQLAPDREAVLENGPTESELLMMQGKPIGEPVAKRGPFVMNTEEEIRQAFSDYRRTEFGGWPWQKDDPVHSRPEGRFAKHVDGRIERPT